MKQLSLLLVFAISIGLYTATAVPPDAIDTPPWQPAGKYTHPEIRESSGIVASQRFEGVYWTLNDSGNPATLYATKLNGELIQEIAVKGSANFDWEALGIDDKNRLWIGEIGNNSRLRMDLKVVVVEEPDPFTETQTEVIASYPYRYPNENVDAEGLFVVKGIPYIVSKERQRAVLYRFPTLQPDTKQVLEKVGEFDGAKFVTGAGVSKDATRLVVCTYNALWVYHAVAGDLLKMIQSTPQHLPHSFDGEAVCFDGNDLVLTNEARDIYYLPQFWYQKAWPLPPKQTLSAATLFTAIKSADATAQVETYLAAGFDMGGSQVAFTPQNAREEATLTIPINAPYRNVYEIRAILTRGQEYGRVELSANGTVVGNPYDCYSAEAIAGTLVNLGTAQLNSGKNRITLKSVGKASEATGYKIGIDAFQLLHASPFVKRYKVLGPFPRKGLRTVDTPYPPETDLDPNATYEGVEGKSISWREATAETDGMLDLRKNIGLDTNVVGYALSYIYAPKAMDTVLLLGSDEAVAVWLNGTEIHRKDGFRSVAPDSDALPCQLQAGWNVVLCKTGQNGWYWSLYLRFTDADGVLRYATEPEPEE